MVSKYSWRDGWALTYPHPIVRVKELNTEPVTRCGYCGAWKITSQACNSCGTESK